MKVSSGNDMQAAQMAGGAGPGYAGTATATTGTGFTASTAVPNSPAGVHVGRLVTMAGLYGVITAVSGTAVTVDRWYTPSSPGSAAPSPPAAGAFVILPGNAPAWYMALGNTNTAPGPGHTGLSDEIVTPGGGLIRQLAAVTHTPGSGTAGYTLTGTFIANGSDSPFPQTAFRIGIFNSLVPGGPAMQFETTISAPATFNASGDQLVVTESVAN